MPQHICLSRFLSVSCIFLSVSVCLCLSLVLCLSLSPSVSLCRCLSVCRSLSRFLSVSLAISPFFIIFSVGVSGLTTYDLNRVDTILVLYLNTLRRLLIAILDQLMKDISLAKWSH